MKMVQLTPTNSGAISVVASLQYQSPNTIATGNATGNNLDYFDVRYFTEPHDSRLIEAKIEEYSTTLQYTITPR